jgi:hypothetical protein
MTTSQVATGVHELEALSKAIVADLDEESGGIGWWKAYDMSLADRWDLSDYLIDVINGAAQNLQIADFLLREYRDKRESADFKIRDRMRRNSGDPLGRGLDAVEDNQRDLRLKSYVYSFFAASSSVLDTLAGTVVGVSALNLPIVRADLRMFGPLLPGRDYPAPKTQLFKSLDTEQSARSLQLELVHAFRTSMLQAGPTDWYVWLERKRNQLSHRGGRLQVISFKRQGRGPDQNRFLLMEKDPELTTIQDFRKDASTLEASHLLEDELSIMEGLLDSINAAVVGTTVSAHSIWEQRRAAPSKLIQPGTQWRPPRPGIQFPGYEPQNDLLKGVTTALVSPTDALRMTAARLPHTIGRF